MGPVVVLLPIADGGEGTVDAAGPTNAGELAEQAGTLVAKDLPGEQPAHPQRADPEDAS